MENEKLREKMAVVTTLHTRINELERRFTDGSLTNDMDDLGILLKSILMVTAETLADINPDEIKIENGFCSQFTQITFTDGDCKIEDFKFLK